MSEIVLETRNIVRDYHISGGFFRQPRTIHAVKGVSLTLEKGKTLAIVGESGCGKSTLARMITMIDEPTGGELYIDGVKVDIAKQGVTPEQRRKVQIVFQNPYGSLNPRQKIGDVLMEPLIINANIPAAERRDRAMAMLKKVGLGHEHFNRYPHMFSGGQRQRIAIARALYRRPSVLIFDEGTSALDNATEAELMDAIERLRGDHTIILVAHRLSTVRKSDRVVFIEDGRITGEGTYEDLIDQHPRFRVMAGTT